MIDAEISQLKPGEFEKVPDSSCGCACSVVQYADQGGKIPSSRIADLDWEDTSKELEQ